MPIEIKELLIEINVSNSKEALKSYSSETSAKKDKNAILAECVEQVVALMENKKER